MSHNGILQIGMNYMTSQTRMTNELWIKRRAKELSRLQVYVYAYIFVHEIFVRGEINDFPSCYSSFRIIDTEQL